MTSNNSQLAVAMASFHNVHRMAMEKQGNARQSKTHHGFAPTLSGFAAVCYGTTEKHAVKPALRYFMVNVRNSLSLANNPRSLHRASTCRSSVLQLTAVPSAKSEFGTELKRVCTLVGIFAAGMH